MGRIAISVAIGPLDKWGYQHTCQECLASQAEFADQVYMVQSTQDATGTQEILNRFGNVVLLSNPSTWLHIPGGEDDHAIRMDEFTVFHMRNLNIGRMAAFDDGYRIVLSTHNNWYIPRRNLDALRRYCEAFEQSGMGTGYTWALAQLHDRLLGPAVRNGGLVNLSWAKKTTEVLDYYPNLKWRHLPASEIPRDVGDLCMVDCSYMLRPDEYEGMQRRMGYPGSETFEWTERREQLASRTRRLNVMLDDKLDYWGERIAAKSGPEFAGYQILHEAGLL